ncbi:MAG: beta-galactosidase, partial [Oscillospiraceae bacterium]|nr:beta-galactosidase [Oscillospiraceae bacterium]
FVYWHDSSAAGRGGPGDQINFDNVSFFGIGLALSHVSVSQGAHEFWFDGVCLLDFEQLSEPALVLDGLSPEWKFYPITNGAKATAFQNQIFVSERDYALPGELFSPSPRPQGTGYGRERELRFVPLIEVFDEKGLRSGYLAWMYINQTARSAGRDYNSSIIASFGSSDPTFYSGSGGEAVLEVVKALLGDAFFVEAGSDEYIYVESETKSIPIGAYVRAKSGEGLTVELELYKSGEIIHKDSLDLSSLKATNKKNDVGLYNISQKYDMASGGPDKIAFTLKKDGLPIDFISHEIVMWSPKPEAERQYITASGNEFMRGGEALRLYGVNYMPSSGIGVNAENGAYFEYYVSSQSYDPDVIQNDLQRVKEIGFNSVSVFVYHHTAQETKNMLHLIDMCDKLGLYVDLSIRPYADPFNLDEAQVADMISLLHIAQLDNIVAYDIAWERYFGTYEGSYGNPSGRKAYDGLWRDWIERNYGSLENAEAIWGYKAPKSGAEAVGPTDEMLRTGGAYDTMVAAYRRFVDGLVSEKHNYVKDLIMEHDPNHLVSTRTGSQGGVPLADPGDMGYDYEALSNGLDFMSPESYAINGRLETSDQGVFTNVYSRYAKPGAPVMWKEFGQHVWNGSNFADKTEELRLQAEYYDAIYEMMLSGHTGAAYCWFWPGGYRVNEGSDYGIINPDGSDRPVTQVIRDHAQRFYAQPPLGEPDIFFEVDRDLSSSGIKAMYEAMQDDFVDAVKSGKTIAFADAATGKDTASVSDAAIGGGTAGAKNPARWVDGEFRAVYIKLSDGSWKRIRRGETVKLDSGPVEIKLVMGNTKNSAWLSANENDSAYISLVSSENSDVAFEIPLAERVEHLGTLTQEFVLCENFDKQAAIAFRFGIKDRFVFGDIFEFNVAEK